MKKPALFSVAYGFESREKFILNMEDEDPTIAVILAAAHFEWTLKRTILMFGKTNTDELREKLANTWSFTNKKSNLRKIWHEEIGVNYKNASMKQVMDGFDRIMERSGDLKKPNASDIRGQIIHGNGTVSIKWATRATDEFIWAARHLYAFSIRNGRRLDKRMVTRN
jgi:hypothetical protein